MQPGSSFGDGRQGRLIGDIAGGEQQGGRPAVQVGKLSLKQDVKVIGAGDVSGPAGARATGVNRLFHRLKDDRVLAHAEIVVGTPNRYVVRSALPVGEAVMRGEGKGTGMTFQLGKNAVVAFPLQAFDGLAEFRLIVHGLLRYGAVSKFCLIVI